MDIIIIMITCFQRNQGGQEHTTAGKKKTLNYINFLPLLVTVGSALAAAVFLCCHFRGFCVLLFCIPFGSGDSLDNKFVCAAV